MSPVESLITEQEPAYRKVAHDEESATQLYFIVCDEGWRESIVCERMYEWAADWLLSVLGRRPFAPRTPARLPVMGEKE